MAIAEMEFDPSKRDFLTFAFARGRRPGGGQPPRRPTQRQPQPPEWGGFKVTRRKALIAGGLAVGSTVAAAILQPWTWFTPPLELESDTLESAVSKAKKMEAEFSGNDLSDESTRNNFTTILADIYVKDAPSDWTKEQIKSSVIWTKNLGEFISVITSNSQKQRAERDQGYFADIPALTTDNKKIVVNLANPAFNTALLRRNNFPQDWNSLKSLRRLFLHEFVHLTTTTKEDKEFFDLTDIPENVENPMLEGFVVQYKEAGRDKEAFHILNELAVETITSERSNRLFGLTPPIPFIEQGVDLSIAQTRFVQVLDAGGIKISELERLNRTSDFYGFLVKLSPGIDFPAETPLANRINYVLGVLDAVLYNNQNLIQEYIKAKQR